MGNVVLLNAAPLNILVSRIRIRVLSKGGLYYFYHSHSHFYPPSQMLWILLNVKNRFSILTSLVCIISLLIELACELYIELINMFFIL